MFDNSADKIILARFNSDGAKVNYREASEAIDNTLCNVDIYLKDGKRIKAVGQWNDSGGGGVTKGEAESLFDVRGQDNPVYYMAACVLHVASKMLQNAMEKNFGDSGLGEETFYQFIHTCCSAQEDLGKNFEA